MSRMEVKAGQLFLIGDKRATPHFYSHAVGLIGQVLDPPTWGATGSLLLQVDWYQPQNRRGQPSDRYSELYIQRCDLLPLPKDNLQLSHFLLSQTLEEGEGQ